MLVASNTFMTFAWYGHLKHKDWPIWQAIVLSWLLAFAEYCFAVPANRIGSETMSTAQLKVLQEAITLAVFLVFLVFYMKEPFRWKYLGGFALVLSGVWVIFADLG